MGAPAEPNAPAVPRALGATAAGRQRHAQRGAHGQPQRAHVGALRYLDDDR